jgi:PIN domain nuclease of toxin-antitoxin system
LALVFGEPGAEMVLPHLQGALISAVNLTEVATKMLDKTVSLERTTHILSSQPLSVIGFDAELAYVAASLRLPTRAFGLSLGDRACLALGLKTGLPVLTTEAAWEKAGTGVQVVRIR